MSDTTAIYIITSHVLGISEVVIDGPHDNIEIIEFLDPEIVPPEEQRVPDRIDKTIITINNKKHVTYRVWQNSTHNDRDLLNQIKTELLKTQIKESAGVKEDGD